MRVLRVRGGRGGRGQGSQISPVPVCESRSQLKALFLSETQTLPSVVVELFSVSAYHDRPWRVIERRKRRKKQWERTCGGKLRQMALQRPSARLSAQQRANKPHRVI